MIIKEYSQNINIHKPRDYFEKWYADFWNRRIKISTASIKMLESLMTEELKQIGAVFGYTDDYCKFQIKFLDDAKYTIFVLKWS